MPKFARSRRRPVPMQYSRVNRFDAVTLNPQDDLPPQPPKRRLRKRRIVLVIAALIVLATGITRSESIITSSRSDSFNKKRYSISEPSSTWVIVNKQRPLNPIDFAPSLADPAVHLNQTPGSENMKVATVMAPELVKLFQSASMAGLPLTLASGYRSYSSQVEVYDREVALHGKETADSESARPGHSEHQTGLAADLAPVDNRCVLLACFGETNEGKWLAQNAWRYGFIIRYPADKSAVTGYTYEPWHVRYVGVELATELHNTHVGTMEEFFGTGPAPAYSK